MTTPRNVREGSTIEARIVQIEKCRPSRQHGTQHRWYLLDTRGRYWSILTRGWGYGYSYAKNELPCVHDVVRLQVASRSYTSLQAGDWEIITKAAVDGHDLRVEYKLTGPSSGRFKLTLQTRGSEPFVIRARLPEEWKEQFQSWPRQHTSTMATAPEWCQITVRHHLVEFMKEQGIKNVTMDEHFRFVIDDPTDFVVATHDVPRIRPIIATTS